MTYFSNFGTAYYTLPDGSKIAVNNITKFATIIKKYRDNPNTRLEYTIKDGDMPHKLSYRLYGTPDYWWTVHLMNSIDNLYEQWPMNYTQLMNYISLKYPYSNPNEIHHYEDLTGIIYDIEAISMTFGISMQDAIDRFVLQPITILAYETAINENKRNIYLIDPDYISQIDKELKALFANG